MSRYFNNTQRDKLTAGKGPMPGNTGSKYLSIPESTAKWNIGKTDSFNPNKGAGFPKVKQSVKTSI